MVRSANIELVDVHLIYGLEEGNARAAKRFYREREKQDMLQLAEELGINATLNMTVPSIKIAITNSEGYEEEFVKNLYETIIANGKRLEELERAEKMRLEEFKIESGFRVNDESNDSTNACSVTSNLNLKKLIPDFDPKQSDISLYLVIFERQAKRASIEKKEWVGQLLDNWANLKSATQIAELFDNYEDFRKTKAAVCGNHLNQHGRYLLGNKTAELIKGNLGYNFLPVEILNAVQTRSQVKAAREERGIDSGDAKKGKMRL
ncbi:pro-Pol polyprotein [Trichonephila clavipes]|uniref:Pro-Pol polyprotein n=1 Tax=Trichonephila clavipes TaxID=2585209 RepID=A0A8X6UVG8_TRICX|nr:pro-Pol polyprotein [Trichonephila clavipes]